jgi:hypothetical protein
MSRPRLLLSCSAWVAGLMCACGSSHMHASSNPRADAAIPLPESNDAAPASPDLPANEPPQTMMDPADLVNLLSPLAWQAGGSGPPFSTSRPCGDEGCSNNTSGLLCARGHIDALACTSPTICDFDTNWGAMIGVNLSPIPSQPWGSSAAKRLGVIFTGGPGEYRLTAHVAGDPEGMVYCVDDYPSAAFVEPPAFLTECWDNTGEALPSFTVIDQLGLQIISAREPIDFDFCISGFAIY